MLVDVLHDAWSRCPSVLELRWGVVGTLVLAAVFQDIYCAGYMWWNRPRKIPIFGPSLLLGKWWSSLKFILSAPKIIERGYKASNDELFAIPSREGYLVFVSTADQIREVENATIDHLSFHQAMEDRLKVKYTFNGFEMGGIDPHDAIPIRVLKTLLRMDLPQLRPRIQSAIEESFDSCTGHVQVDLNGWKRINTFHMAEDMSLRVNCKVIFGEKLANNAEFLGAARGYHRQALVAMLTSHYLPHWTDKYTIPSILAMGGAMKKLDKYVTEAVYERLMDMRAGKKDIPKDAITWIIDASTTKEQQMLKRLVQQVFAVFFASAHQLPSLLMFATYRLCEHPEYFQPLIAEAETMLKLPEADHYKTIPMMESFLREAGRHDPLDSLSVQRKVLKDFTFSNGGVVPAGNVICVPQQVIMRDERYFEKPDEFLPFRFVQNTNKTGKSEDEVANRKLTDLEPNFYLWGAAKKPCPGRWYASAVLQQFFAYLLTEYNFRLADPTAKLTMMYTTIVFPRPGLEIEIQKR